MSLNVILLVVSLILAILAALPVNSKGVNLLAASFAFFILSLLIG